MIIVGFSFLFLFLKHVFVSLECLFQTVCMRGDYIRFCADVTNITSYYH